MSRTQKRFHYVRTLITSKEIPVWGIPVKALESGQ